MRRITTTLALGVLLMTAADASAQTPTADQTSAPAEVTISATIPSVLFLSVTGTPTFPGATDAAWRTAMTGGTAIAASTGLTISNAGNIQYNVTMKLDNDVLTGTYNSAEVTLAGSKLLIADRAVGTGNDLFASNQAAGITATNTATSVKLLVGYGDVPTTYSNKLTFTIVAR
jgi:hypothetical protein